MNLNFPKLSEESLERLVIAIIQLETDRGLKINIRPEDVLQDNILAQIPRPDFKALFNCNV